MIIANFHTHSAYCDGRGEPEKYIRKAIARGLQVLGFSSHAPVPYKSFWNMKVEKVDHYLETIARLKQRYQKQLEIYTGLEIDYLPGDKRNIFQKYPLDYRIGSVHLFYQPGDSRYYSIDGTDAEFRETLEVLFQGQIAALVQQYYRYLCRMVTEHQPEIIGHLDVIKKNNDSGKYFSEKEAWYQEAVAELLAVIKARGSIVEVNTGGISRGYTQEVYPSPWILKKCCQLGIPVMINSDAHTPEHIDSNYAETRQLLTEIGYQKQRILLNRKWQDVLL